MLTSLIALTALFATNAAPESVTLTPGTAAAHGYHLRCVILDPTKQRDPGPGRPGDTVLVQVRFGRLPGGSTDDLAPIKSVSLQALDGDALLFAVPVGADVDPGDRVHLAFRFSVRKDLLPKVRLVIDEDGPQGPRRLTADVQAFVGEK